MKSASLLKMFKHEVKTHYPEAMFELAPELEPNADYCLLIHVAQGHREGASDLAAHLNVQFYMEHGIYIMGFVREAPTLAAPATV